MEGEPVEQSMEAFGLQRPFSAGREPEHLDGAQRGRAQRVIDLGASHSELGIDQGAGGERQPDLIFGATLVVQRQQLGQQLLDRATRIAGKLEPTTRCRIRSAASSIAKSSSSDCVRK